VTVMEWDFDVGCRSYKGGDVYQKGLLSLVATLMDDLCCWRYSGAGYMPGTGLLNWVLNLRMDFFFSVSTHPRYAFKSE